MSRLHGIILVSTLGIALGAPNALAIAAGQSGATGRPNGGLCNRCHGTQLYDGLTVAMPQAIKKDCFARTGADGAGPFAFTNSFFIVPFSQPGAPFRTTLSVQAAAPPETVVKAETCTFGFQANCNAVAPQTCCSTEGDVCQGGQCVVAKSLYCPLDQTCAAPVAGFDIEIVGQGHLEASDPGSKGIGTPLGPGQFNEVAHNAPRAFAGGAVSWDLVYQSPERQGINNAQGATLYAAVNACNANGIQDAGDITTIADIDVFYSDPATGLANTPECIEAPDCANVTGSEGLNLADLSCCPEGLTHDVAGGACVGGCTCVSGSTTTASVGGAAALFLAAMFTRRRRRDRA